MSCKTYCRDERDGLRLVVPLAGPRKFSNLLLNDTAARVLDDVTKGLTIEVVETAYLERAFADSDDREPERDLETKNSNRGGAITRHRVVFDLFQILLQLKRNDLCDYSDAALLQLLPEGAPVPRATQIMPLGMVNEVAEFAADSLQSSGRSRILFSNTPEEALDSDYLHPSNLAGRHLSAEETCFIGLAAGLQIEAVIGLSEFCGGRATLLVNHFIVRNASAADFVALAEAHLGGLIDLLSRSTVATLLRFQYMEGTSQGVMHDCFRPLLLRLGFEKSFRLKDQLGRGLDLSAYDRYLG